jgi:hypothetical protein
MADTEPFEPDWRLSPHEALATHVRIALHRRGIGCAGKLDTDEQWSQMCLEILKGLANDRISPCRLVELRRDWDRK